MEDGTNPYKMTLTSNLKNSLGGGLATTSTFDWKFSAVQQVGLLLSLQPDSGKRIWLWAQFCDDAQQWAALRRAVYAPARSAEPTPNDDAGQAVNR